MAIDGIDDVRDLLLRENAIHEIERHGRVAGQYLGQDHAARRGFHPGGDRLTVGIDPLVTARDLCVDRNRVGIERLPNFPDTGEIQALATLAVTFHGDVIEPKNDVLRRHDDRLAVRGGEDVVGRHHQNARFELSLERKWHMDGHLVAIEVGVERGADERMELNGFALDQDRLESLNAETMERGGAIEQHGMLTNDLLEDVPNLGTLLLDHSLRRLDRGRVAIKLELRIDERLE